MNISAFTLEKDIMGRNLGLVREGGGDDGTLQHIII